MKITKTKCTHYWLIEPNISPESKGVCKYCGATSMFLNNTYILPKFPMYNKPRKEIDNVKLHNAC